MQSASENYIELREAMRDLCGQFTPEYHRTHDENATYPVEFINAPVSYTHLTLPTKA